MLNLDDLIEATLGWDCRAPWKSEAIEELAAHLITDSNGAPIMDVSAIPMPGRIDRADLIARLVAAAPELLVFAARARWQEISSAPKDGSVILYMTESGQVGSCSWSNGHWLDCSPLTESWEPVDPVLWMEVPKREIENTGERDE